MPILVAAAAPPVGLAVPVTTLPIPVAAVPAVAAPIPITTSAAPVGMAIPVATVAVVAAERLLRLMDCGADCRPDLFPSRLGLGLGAVRCRGNPLAHISPGLARTAAPVGMAIPVAMVAVPVAAVPAVAAPIPITTSAAAFARIGTAFATTTVAATTITATATALSVGNVVMDRQERSRQTAKEWDQCDHDDCQHQIPEERCHG